MDIGSIIGIIAAYGLIIMAIGTQLVLFISVPSALIVIGGTLGATMVNFPLSDVIGAINVAKNVFFVKKSDASEVIRDLIEYASKARKEGILVLESVVGSIKDEFLAKGVQLAVDGLEPKFIQKILETEIEKIEDRHKSGADVFMAMATLCPAFGLIGTLVGLVLMLQSMEDPSSIGPAMAVALIITFYGAVLANTLFIPMSGKLKARSKEEVLLKELVLEGILSIAGGDNPRIMEQKLNAFLPPKLRKTTF
tara:strand:+ start:191 stop:946 length:756 start_codon:yes stop_codon:yes gene_type:complete